MEEKELKTSPGQRALIIIIAVIMLGSIIASYAAIIVSGSKKAEEDDSDTSSQISEAKKKQYEEEYNKKVEEFNEATKADYEKFIAYKSEVKAYNETSANEGGVQKKDLKEGSGDAVDPEGSNYLAYYIGWCADESIFDSSFDDNDEPTAFARALDPSMGLIEGWKQGVEGMKIGGVRRITVPGELAYGESQEICGGKNKPLRFLIMAVAKEDPLKTISQELDTASMKYQYAQYGIDYDDMGSAGATE